MFLMKIRRTQPVFEVFSHVVALDDKHGHVVQSILESAYFRCQVFAIIKQTNFNDCKSGIQ